MKEQSFGEKMVGLNPPGVDPFGIHAQKRAFATQFDALHDQKISAAKEGNEELVKNLEKAIETLQSSLRIVFRR